MLNDRFWTKVDKDHPNGCWVWTANRNNKGYGMFRPGGLAPKRLAHRLSYEDAFGAIPRGGLILHSCDNPQCVNPSHLRVGTVKDNSQDMVTRGRHVPNAMKGEENKNAKLTDDIVLSVRRDYVSGVSLDDISRRYGIPRISLGDYTGGHSWRHLFAEGPTEKELKDEAQKRRRNNSRLDKDAAQEIRARLAKGETGKSLAIEYGVTPATISDIKLGRTWA